MELNKEIEIIAVESIARSRILLAKKGIDINKLEAECLSVLLSNGQAFPNDSMDLIARATTFNAYDFLQEKDKANNLLLFKGYLSDDTVKIINNLFANNC